MTTAGRLVVRDQATESHFATPGLFNVTSGRGGRSGTCGVEGISARYRYDGGRGSFGQKQGYRHEIARMPLGPESL